MNKLNIVKKLNILIYILFSILCIFEIAKIIYYASHRPLASADIRYLLGTIEMLVLFTVFFIFAMLYAKSGKFRKTTLILLVVCLLLSVLKINQVVLRFNFLVLHFTLPKNYAALNKEKASSEKILNLIFIH